ncbi:hypothetical protein OIU77_027817 [Salix suchowensis]|uniref:PHD finger protein ALFIN-LIKE n=1 Tax=Salix suchowensis TaxID=1278906 RepID=A0ABQ9BT47_9ROSI|nr:hypothetical protein OIU77_027817 [Salix suchowensis]
MEAIPRTVEEVFSDFKGRRSGLIKALTTDVEKFYQQCDPGGNLKIRSAEHAVTANFTAYVFRLGEDISNMNFKRRLEVNGFMGIIVCAPSPPMTYKENLCLYGLPNETWEVNLPVEEVPPELPEPALGINFARDGMQEKDWLSLVAVHSDSWLLAVAFYFGARFGFGKNERWNLLGLGMNCSWKTRKRLFQMINELPTIFEVVSGNAKQPKDQSATHNNSGKSKSSGKIQSRQPESQTKPVKVSAPPKEDYESGEEEEEDDEQGATCGACGESYGTDEFWICCDMCEKWFHGKCVKITPAKAEHIKQYKQGVGRWKSFHFILFFLKNKSNRMGFEAKSSEVWEQI